MAEYTDVMNTERNRMDGVVPAENSVEEKIVQILLRRGWTISAAESCTGGMVSARLVNVPGISSAYKMGVTTYANEAKIKLLGVKRTTLKAYGAVSSQTAVEMVKGCRKFAKADAAIAITGIAGPDGGTPEKPVGLVYIACDVRGGLCVKKCMFEGNRQQVREQAAQTALELMYKCLA